LITLSARSSTFGGIVSPICLAVFRLIQPRGLRLFLDFGFLILDYFGIGNPKSANPKS